MTSFEPSPDPRSGNNAAPKGQARPPQPAWASWFTLLGTAIVVGLAAWTAAFLALAPLAGLRVLSDPIDAVVVLVVAYVVGALPAALMAALYGLFRPRVRPRTVRLALAAVIGGAGTFLLTLFAFLLANAAPDGVYSALVPASGALSAVLCALIAELVAPDRGHRHG